MLFSGERREKDSAVFSALGDVDELNASIGIARAECDLVRHGSVVTTDDAEILASLSSLRAQLDQIQSELFDLGSAVATPLSSSSEARQRRARFEGAQESVTALEGWIDEMELELPPLRNFILPSGGPISSRLHVARAVCRRAERAVVLLVRGGECESEVGIYLNRLSDYLFVAARYASLRSGHDEVSYQKPKHRS